MCVVSKVTLGPHCKDIDTTIHRIHRHMLAVASFFWFPLWWCHCCTFHAPFCVHWHMMLSASQKYTHGLIVFWFIMVIRAFFVKWWCHVISWWQWSNPECVLHSDGTNHNNPNKTLKHLWKIETNGVNQLIIDVENNAKSRWRHQMETFSA